MTKISANNLKLLEPMGASVEENIINKLTFEQGFGLARVIDECAFEAWKIPKWLLTHNTLLQFYAGWKKLEIRQTSLEKVEFWKEGKPKARLLIMGGMVRFCRQPE